VEEIRSEYDNDVCYFAVRWLKRSAVLSRFFISVTEIDISMMEKSKTIALSSDD
jgi:hypothetical protein